MKSYQNFCFRKYCDLMKGEEFLADDDVETQTCDFKDEFVSNSCHRVEISEKEKLRKCLERFKQTHKKFVNNVCII